MWRCSSCGSHTRPRSNGFWPKAWPTSRPSFRRHNSPNWTGCTKDSNGDGRIRAPIWTLKNGQSGCLDVATGSKKDHMTDSTHFATSLKRGLLGLAAASLLALAGYALLAKSAEEPSRAGQTPAGARSMPVLAASTRVGDIGVYLNGLGSVVP